MARMFQRSNAEKLAALRASEADLRSGRVSGRVTVIEELLEEVDIVELKEQVDDQETRLDDHEARIIVLEAGD